MKARCYSPTGARPWLLAGDACVARASASARNWATSSRNSSTCAASPRSRVAVVGTSPLSCTWLPGPERPFTACGPRITRSTVASVSVNVVGVAPALAPPLHHAQYASISRMWVRSDWTVCPRPRCLRVHGEPLLPAVRPCARQDDHRAQGPSIEEVTPTCTVSRARTCTTSIRLWTLTRAIPDEQGFHPLPIGRRNKCLVAFHIQRMISLVQHAHTRLRNERFLSVRWSQTNHQHPHPERAILTREIGDRQSAPLPCCGIEAWASSRII